MQPVCVAFRIAVAAVCLSGMAGAGPDARAAGVYRCPDGSYQDKPCGEGAKLVTRTSREGPPEKGQDPECLARAKLGEKFARDKAGGASPEDILARVDKEFLPYEERVARKKFAAEALQMKGGPAEVKATIEADCLEAKAAAKRKAAEDRMAAEKTDPAPSRKAGEGAANTSQTNAERAERDAKATQEARGRACEDARLSLESARAAERKGGSVETMEMLRASTRAADARVKKNCG